MLKIGGFWEQREKSDMAKTTSKTTHRSTQSQKFSALGMARAQDRLGSDFPKFREKMGHQGRGAGASRRRMQPAGRRAKAPAAGRGAAPQLCRAHLRMELLPPPDLRRAKRPPPAPPPPPPVVEAFLTPPAPSCWRYTSSSSSVFTLSCSRGQVGGRQSVTKHVHARRKWGQAARGTGVHMHHPHLPKLLLVHHPAPDLHPACKSPYFPQHTCSNDGRTLGSRCQHRRMMSDSGGGQFGGMGGRSPFCTTPTAACRGVISL